MASLRNPADIVNAGLVRIGYKNLIANLRDGSEAANQALAVYGQTRDEMLRSSDWDFAQRSVSLTLLKQAPASYVAPTVWDPTLYPPPGWNFEYGYPDDCIKVRVVKQAPVFQPNFDPGPNPYSVANDEDLAVRVILCNVEAAILTYTGRVTDPSLWAVDFAEAFVEMLGERLAPSLTSPQMAQFEAAEGGVQSGKASMEQG